MQIRFKKLHPDAKLPRRGSNGAAGYDIFCHDFDIVGDIFVYSTGLAVEIPEGYYGIIYPRSSGAFRALAMHGPTVIDGDYRGEIVIMYHLRFRSEQNAWRVKDWLNDLGKDHALGNLAYSSGDRIAQLVVQPCVSFEPVWAETLSETARGTGGYGSTGR